MATIDGPPSAAATLHQILSGRGAIATSTSARVVWVRFVRALADVADARRWSATSLAGLDDVQIEMLVALGSGASVRDAARATGLSARSAHRQLTRSRELLGVTTNAAAAAHVIKALAEIR